MSIMEEEKVVNLVFSSFRYKYENVFKNKMPNKNVDLVRVIKEKDNRINKLSADLRLFADPYNGRYKVDMKEKENNNNLYRKVVKQFMSLSPLNKNNTTEKTYEKLKVSQSPKKKIINIKKAIFPLNLYSNKNLKTIDTNENQNITTKNDNLNEEPKTNRAKILKQIILSKSKEKIQIKEKEKEISNLNRSFFATEMVEEQQQFFNKNNNSNIYFKLKNNLNKLEKSENLQSSINIITVDTNSTSLNQINNIDKNFNLKTERNYSYLPTLTHERKNVSLDKKSINISISNLKKELPSIFKNCYQIVDENNKIYSNVNKLLVKSEKLHKKAKNYEKSKQIEALGGIEKNDNVFIYGEGDGKFLNNEKLLKNSKHLSALNSEVAYNVKGLISKNFMEIETKKYNVFANDKHMKVEDILSSMENINENLLKKISIVKKRSPKSYDFNTIM